MKKIVLMFALMVSALMSANAQIATENSKFADNTFITVNGGVATPLALDAVFPLNPTVGLSVGKWLTQEYGIEVEGTTWLGSHVYGGTDARVNMNANGNFNAFRGIYVGANGLINVTNLFKGYEGKPRVFETNAVVGIGWVHGFTPNTCDRYNNALGAKTGLDFSFNIGKTKAQTLSIRPAVLWDLSRPGTTVGSLAFNRLGAQLYLGVGYTFHFKNANGTRYFKTYDVGAMSDEINRLNDEIASLRSSANPQVVEKIVDKSVTIIRPNEWFVQFAQGSAELTNTAIGVLNSIENGITVKVVGTASPEGADATNKSLSDKRAEVVADFLTKKGVKVESWSGKGVQNGASTNRLAIITLVRP